MSDLLKSTQLKLHFYIPSWVNSSPCLKYWLGAKRSPWKNNRKNVSLKFWLKDYHSFLVTTKSKAGDPLETKCQIILHICSRRNQHRPTPISNDMASFCSLLVGSDKPFAISSPKGSVFWSSLHPNFDSFNAFWNLPVLDKDAGSSNTDGRRRVLLISLSLLFCWGEKNNKQTNHKKKSYRWKIFLLLCFRIKRLQQIRKNINRNKIPRREGNLVNAYVQAMAVITLITLAGRCDAKCIST